MCLKVSRTSQIALSICFTSDNERYLSLNAHFLTSCWKIKSLVIGCRPTSLIIGEKASSDNVAQWIKGMLQNLNVVARAVTAVVHCDNDCVRKGVKKLSEEYNWHYISCFRSKLSDFTAKACNRCITFNGFRKINDTVHFFSNNPFGKAISNRLRELQGEVEKSRAHNAVPVEKGLNLKNSDVDLEIVDDVFKALHPVEAVLSYLSKSSFVPSSIVPVLLTGLKDRLSIDLVVSNSADRSSNEKDIDVKLKRTLLKALENITSFGQNDIIIMAASLDPRCRKLSFIDESKRETVRYKIVTDCYLLEEDNSTDERFSQAGNYDAEIREMMHCGAGIPKEQVDSNMEEVLKKVKNETERYFAEEPASVETCPFAWWRTNQTRYPVIARLARTYLSIPAVASCFSNAPNETLSS